MNFLKYILILAGLNKINGFLISKFRSLLDFSFLNPENILKNENSDISTIDNGYKDLYSLHWYVIGETRHFKPNRLKKITVWDKDYTVWKDSKTNTFHAIDDDCSHKGASLSGGYLKGGCVVCPYHGYEFAANGTLLKVPGLEFTNTPCKNQITYPVFERNGWIYLNRVPKLIDSNTNDTYYIETITEEQEAGNPDFAPIFLNVNFKAYSRIVSENSLDVMHIGFVHTFGNSEFPSPLHEVPPFPITKHHWRTEYDYLSGKKSFAKKLFGINQLKIQNEFALPHMTVARILFGKWISTVVTFATPINITHTQLFVKTYRNFWKAPVHSQNLFDSIYNYFGNYFTSKLMLETVMQDKSVVENIKLNKADGKYNMKYDKLSNTYRTFYKKYVHSIE
jgi:phenylpropionate dioxygenase-like ring-hydroxylating dioxygenase large terminal subunit